MLTGLVDEMPSWEIYATRWELGSSKPREILPFKLYISSSEAVIESILIF